MGSLGRLVKSGTWLYLTTIINNVSGYIYWLLVTMLAGPEVLGLTSATIGLGATVGGVAGLGVAAALQRHIAACRGDAKCMSEYFWTSLVFTLAVYSVAASALYGAGLAGLNVSGYTPEMLEAAAVLTLLTGLASIPFSYVVAVLETKEVLKASIIGNVLKILLGAALVALGYGWAGAVAGFMALSAVQLAVLLPQPLERLGLGKPTLPALLETLKAGIVVWLPGTVTLLGQWLGVITVFGYSGASETGHYYVAFMVANLAAAPSMVILGTLVPMLSSMEKGRGELASRALRLALFLSTPIVGLLIAYPQLPLALLGRAYTDAADILRLLALGILPNIATTVIAGLAYAQAYYGRQLAIGLAQNLPRIILYPVLTSLMGGMGAAIAMTTGSLTGLAYALYTASMVGFKLEAQAVARILVPASITVLASMLVGLPWPLGVVLHIALYPAYTRLGTVRRSDLREIAQTFIPGERVETVYRKLRNVIDLLIPEQ